MTSPATPTCTHPNYLPTPVTHIHLSHTSTYADRQTRGQTHTGVSSLLQSSAHHTSPTTYTHTAKLVSKRTTHTHTPIQTPQAQASPPHSEPIQYQHNQSVPGEHTPPHPRPYFPPPPRCIRRSAPSGTRTVDRQPASLLSHAQNTNADQ